MRKALTYSLALVAGLCTLPNLASAEEEIIIEGPRSGVPVQNAILTRRFGPVETEDEVASQELEAGVGATNTFKAVGWRRYYRPYGYGWYGRPYGWYGFYGPRYYAAYRPGFYGYYGGYAPYSYWGGYYGAPYINYYTPPVC